MMTAVRLSSFALLALVASLAVVGCGSNNSGTTPQCSGSDASDCFTEPDGGTAEPTPQDAAAQD